MPFSFNQREALQRARATRPTEPIAKTMEALFLDEIPATRRAFDRFFHQTLHGEPEQS